MQENSDEFLDKMRNVFNFSLFPQSRRGKAARGKWGARSDRERRAEIGYQSAVRAVRSALLGKRPLDPLDACLIALRDALQLLQAAQNDPRHASDGSGIDGSYLGNRGIAGTY